MDSITNDFSQLEVRALAHQYLPAGLDLHRLTAAWLCGVRYNQVTQHQRNQAKARNYAHLYGPEPDFLMPPTEALKKIFSAEEYQAYVDLLKPSHPDLLSDALKAHLMGKEKPFERSPTLRTARPLPEFAGYRPK